MDQHEHDQPHDGSSPAGPAQPAQPVGKVSFHKPPTGSGTASFHRLSFDGEAFRPGRSTSESALRRYLLTRALGRSVISTVQWSGVAILLIAVLCWLTGVKVLAVLVAIVAVVVMLVRAALSALERRLSGAARLGAMEPQVSAMVSRTGRGLRRELRRVGLPGVPWAPLLIALRIIRPVRRAETLRALSRVELASVVPASQLDELQLLLQAGRR
jgi:hypothetical protein